MLPDLSVKRSSASCCNFGKNEIYIFGGYNDILNSVDVIDKFDIFTNQMT